MNMRTFEIEEAQTDFAQLIEKVAAGGEAILAKQGEPLARLIPFDAPPDRKSSDCFRGRSMSPTSSAPWQATKF